MHDIKTVHKIMHITHSHGGARPL